MGEHYNLNTVEVSHFCKKESRMTPHRVSGGKLGFCIPCYEASEAERAARMAAPAKPEPEQQLGLFGEKL